MKALHQSPSNFHFKGRYTLRGINGVWQVYDRELNSIVLGSPSEHTFTKATLMLERYKAQEEMRNRGLNLYGRGVLPGSIFSSLRIRLRNCQSQRGKRRL
jgi:hypothetical protein